MYRMHNKTETGTGETISTKDCFAQSTKNWFWIIGIIIVGAVVYAIITHSGQNPAYSSTSRLFPQHVQARNAAFIRCPYCPGFLDAQGRCNVRDCPIYSPSWVSPSKLQNIPLKRVLIKELALEVSPLEGKASVIIYGIYAGGRGEAAGLQAGDRIYRFNGRKVKNVKQFQTIVARAKPESDVKIQVIRNKKKIKLTMRIGEGGWRG